MSANTNQTVEDRSRKLNRRHREQTSVFGYVFKGNIALKKTIHFETNKAFFQRNKLSIKGSVFYFSNVTIVVIVVLR